MSLLNNYINLTVLVVAIKYQAYRGTEFVSTVTMLLLLVRSRVR